MIEDDAKGATGRRGEHLLRLPTIRIHGKGDPRLELHRQLLEQNSEEGSARLGWRANEEERSE